MYFPQSAPFSRVLAHSRIQPTFFSAPSNLLRKCTLQQVYTARLSPAVRSISTTRVITSQPSLLSTSFIGSIRHASTTADADPSSSTQPKPASQRTSLAWNEFLRLRKIRRRYNLGTSVVGSVMSLTAGMSVLSQQNLEQLAQQMFGLDPFFVIIIWSMGFLGVGWLLGPLVGTGVFRMMHRKQMSDMAAKERDFFERIKKYRVDPTSSSMQNPVPDYYGEKITSVQGYRQWLKDQRAFNRKRQSFV